MLSIVICCPQSLKSVVWAHIVLTADHAQKWLGSLIDCYKVLVRGAMIRQPSDTEFHCMPHHKEKHLLCGCKHQTHPDFKISTSQQGITGYKQCLLSSQPAHQAQRTWPSSTIIIHRNLKFKTFPQLLNSYCKKCTLRGVSSLIKYPKNKAANAIRVPCRYSSIRKQHRLTFPYDTFR